MDGNVEQPASKRRRLSNEYAKEDSQLPRTLTSPISPPPLRRKKKAEPQAGGPKLLKSPFQLTWIQDLPEASNKDAVSLKDILGDPLISECWEFNYLHDLDFLMDAFDPDVRDLVKVHVIHGFWKQEDTSRQSLQLQAKKYKNLTLHTAFMPEMFGTHHSKMLILLRHDSTAQIIIHTANLIPFDWTNMTQAVWRSPLLPLLSPSLPLSSSPPSPSPPPTSSPLPGTGSKFKTDLLNYLHAYDTKRIICKPLISTLSHHDFSSIRASLIASVPGKQGIETDSPTSWGWAGLQNVLKYVPVKSTEPEIVVQISSIATLGPTDKWLKNTFFKALGTVKREEREKATYKIIFPTADEIRRSLNGYASGNAIHTKIQSTAQQKQLQYLKPIFCHWAGDGEDSKKEREGEKEEEVSDAGRKRAAPHIKTYIRFSDKTHEEIDWMLLTSANLSKQAWGEAMNSAGDIRICSYEIGVLVWPDLFKEGEGEKIWMVPTFKTDTPSASTGKGKGEGDKVIGARMPYDLPLVPYGRDDEPWCATSRYEELDWMGESYGM